MKIDLQSIDKTNFMTHDHVVNGEVLTLVQPLQMGVKWVQDNKHFRSSVWNYEGELVSAGFPKFTNFGENPENFPVPSSLKGCTVVGKLDGSLLIVSKYKGEYILRTRGTVDATQLANGHELEVFKTNVLIPLAAKMNMSYDTWNFSLLFEWVSPLQKIVISYGNDPDWYLIGIVDHTNYSLETQSNLDMHARAYSLKRPEMYTFSDVDDLLKNVESWKGKEGVVIYSRNDQMLHKCKAAHYLMLHHMKSELSSVEKILDVWLAQDMPSYNDFYSYIMTTFDFELAEQVKGQISKMCDAYKEVNKITDHMQGYAHSVKHLPRKDAAQKIIGSYGDSNRASFVFTLLDGKPLTKDQIKKLMFQCLKK